MKLCLYTAIRDAPCLATSFVTIILSKSLFVSWPTARVTTLFVGYFVRIRSAYLMSLSVAMTDASASIRSLSWVAPTLSVSSHSLSDAFKSPSSIDVACWLSLLNLSFSVIIHVSSFFVSSVLV